MNRSPKSKDWNDRTQLLARVASLYHELGLTQGEVARQVGVSRSTVSRLLSEARQQGIVEIRICHPLSRSVVLEQELKERFSLKAARVLGEDNLDYEEMVRRLGALAAEYLDDQLYDGALLGLGWGTAVSAVVRAMRRPGRFSVDVVQLVGSAGRVGRERDGLELARHLADVFGGRCLYMRAPIIVQTPEVAQVLLQDPEIQEALNSGKKADFAVVGLGSVSQKYSTILESGYISAEELEKIAQAGAVGDICFRWFDAQGQECEVSLNRRVIGLSLNQLRAIPRVTAVAGGIWKVEAILGTLQGGLVDVLVTDRLTAELVLRSALLTADRSG